MRSVVERLRPDLLELCQEELRLDPFEHVADGTHMDRYGQRQLPAAAQARVAAVRVLRTPDGKPNLAGDWAAEQRVMADPRVAENRGRTAIERGPIVSCAEWPDADPPAG